ncbi:putative protein TPRXL [Patiria miniata]|uniref:Uncharacterized protein n=1 Tax=Patiria miniata TaxID=46514 RepID=A0A913ZUE9_PATMI|nr:putative protein TPRXL [Patiria miniata]
MPILVHDDGPSCSRERKSKKEKPHREAMSGKTRAEEKVSDSSPAYMYHIVNPDTLTQSEDEGRDEDKPTAKPFANLNLNEASMRGPDGDQPYEVPQAKRPEGLSPKTPASSNDEESSSSSSEENRHKSSTTNHSHSSRSRKQANSNNSTRNSQSSQKSQTGDSREEQPYEVPRLLSPESPLTSAEKKVHDVTNAQQTQSDASSAVGDYFPLQFTP